MGRREEKMSGLKRACSKGSDGKMSCSDGYLGIPDLAGRVDVLLTL
jgi:hypothetical protein